MNSSNCISAKQGPDLGRPDYHYACRVIPALRLHHQDPADPRGARRVGEEWLLSGLHLRHRHHAARLSRALRLRRALPCSARCSSPDIWAAPPKRISTPACPSGWPHAGRCRRPRLGGSLAARAAAEGTASTRAELSPWTAYLAGASRQLLLAFARLLPVADGDAAHDWPRFGFDVAGSNSSTAPAGIAASDLAKCARNTSRCPAPWTRRRCICMRCTVRGAKHDVFFVTTSYGITARHRRRCGTILWQHSPPVTTVGRDSRR